MSRDDEELRGRRILVTGASAGIGAAIFTALVEQGAAVVGVARRGEEVARLADRVGGGSAVAADLTDQAGCVAAVAETVEILGGLDAVVHNAGAYLLGTVAEGHPDDWRRMVDLNVLAVLAVTQAAIPHLTTAPRADVVVINSTGGRRVASPASTVYSATKYAEHAIVDGLRKELREAGVRVSVVAPGVVATDIGEANRDPQRRAEVRAAMAAHSIEPEHVADAVRYLLALPPHVAVHELMIGPTAQPL